MSIAPPGDYFDYLMTRSTVGHLYRRFVLYPRLCRHLQGRTLDVGCGIGDLVEFRGGDTVGVDVNRRCVEHCVARALDVRAMDIDVLPFAAAEFDSVVLDNVLEHVVDPTSLLAEIRRVLRPGGRFLVGVPGLRGYASDPDHKALYFIDEDRLVRTVTAAGFELRSLFHTPLVRSEWLSVNLRQYCVYGSFERPH